MTTKPEAAQPVPEKRKGWVRNVVAIAIAAVVVVAAALAPAALLRLEDAVLFETAQPRQQQGGDLSDGSYLAWVFLARANASELPRYSEQNTMEAYEVTNTLYSRFHTMTEAGIFQPDMPSMLMDSIYQSGLEVMTENTLDNYGFETLNLYSYSGELQGVYIFMTTEKRTGRVVQLHCYSSMPETSWFYEEMTYSSEEVLQQYLSWLGLGEMHAWELIAADTYTMEADGWVQAMQYWGNAQLGLAVQLEVGPDYFSLYLTAYNK